MSMQSNKSLVRRYYDEVLTGRKVEILDELLSPGFTSRFGAHVADAAAYRSAVLRSLATFPDLRVEILSQVAEGDLVATRWLAHGTITIAATGERRQAHISAMHFHRIENGRLAEHWEELDSDQLAKLFA